MDPIDAITGITRAVMRRLLGLDDASTEPREIHVHVHVHHDGPDEKLNVKAQFPFRYRGKP
jgi:hypothetical protein